MNTPASGSTNLTKTEEQAATATPILDDILSAGSFSDKESRKRGVDLIEDFVQKVAEGQTVGRDISATVNDMLAAIDERISRQLDAIMHDKEFQSGIVMARPEVSAG